MTGEIIAIASQVLDVIEYMHDIDNQDFVVDAFGFDFDLLRPGNVEGEKVLKDVMDNLNEGDSKKFLNYLSILSIDGNASNEAKVEAFNKMFKNIRGLSDWISYKLSETHNRKEYEALKAFYRTAYYSREMREIFTINIEEKENTRTACTYFEYLYYINPKLYSAIFKPNYEGGYRDYIKESGKDPDLYSMDDYLDDVAYGRIVHRYDTLNTENNEIRVSESLLYYFIDHIIYKLSQYIDDIDMLYIRNDTETPLEKLLVRMIKFFKSLTVDLLGLDIIFICDFKNENILRLFDEVWYMKKVIEVDENYNMLLSDVVRRIITKIHQRSDLKLTDQLMLIAYLRLINREDNLLFGADMVHTVESYLECIDMDANRISLYDTISVLETMLVEDKKDNHFHLRDKIVKKWYSE